MKTDRSDEQPNKLEKYDMQHETLERVLFGLETATHRLENLLPPKPLKLIFDEIREDRAWYLRDSLVKDCISRSNCCGRDSRCCENRHLGKLRGRRRGIGHCTIECWCCQVSRGLENNEKEINEFLKDLKEDMDLHLQFHHNFTVSRRLFHFTGQVSIWEASNR